MPSGPHCTGQCDGRWRAAPSGTDSTRQPAPVTLGSTRPAVPDPAARRAGSAGGRAGRTERLAAFLNAFVARAVASVRAGIDSRPAFTETGRAAVTVRAPPPFPLFLSERRGVTPQ